MRTAGHRIFLLNLDNLRPRHILRAIPLLQLAALASLAVLTSCGSSGSGFSYQNVTITVTPQVASVPVNGTVTFTSTTTNAPNDPSWTLIDFYGNSLGSLSTASGPTCVYTAPASPPIYNPPTSYSVNGTVTLWAVTPTDIILGNGVLAAQTFVITAPSVTTAITPLTVTVPLNTTAQFDAYAVGNINNAITVQVNGVTGGSTTTGTIVHTATQLPGFYLYTAPANMPMTGDTVTITVISQADPTKTATAIVTLQ